MALPRIKKHQIEIAQEMLVNSMIIVYGYLHNKGSMLTEQDLKMFDLFVEELDRHHCTTSFISCCLHQSSVDEAERHTRH